MLAKRIVCNISGSLVSIAMSGKMKTNPGSGRIWNLIVGVFRGSSKQFLQRVYSLASAVDSDCSRTAPVHCYGSTQQL